MSRPLGIGYPQNNTSGYFGYAGHDVFNDGVGWVGGNTDINGNVWVYVESCGLNYQSNGNAQAFINKDGVVTSGGTYVNSGGTIRWGFHKTGSGSTYYGRNSAGSPSPVRNTRDSVTLAGTITGVVNYIICSLPPAAITVAPHPTADLGAKITFSGMPDDGGGSFTGYKVWQRVNGGAWTVASGLSGTQERLLTGLTEGASYEFAVTSNTNVGESARRISAAYIPTAPANISRFEGAVFDDRVLSRYDGTVQDQTELKHWNGSAWADAK